MVTIPLNAFTDAGFKPGDAVRAEAIGPDAIHRIGGAADLIRAEDLFGRIVPRRHGHGPVGAAHPAKRMPTDAGAVPQTRVADTAGVPVDRQARSQRHPVASSLGSFARAP